MANSPSARKRARQAEKARKHNASLRSAVRTSIKKVLLAINGQNFEAAKQGYKEAVSCIDSMINKGIIHKNKAARHKSRLNTKLKAMSATEAKPAPAA